MYENHEISFPILIGAASFKNQSTRSLIEKTSTPMLTEQEVDRWWSVIKKFRNREINVEEDETKVLATLATRAACFFLTKISLSGGRKTRTETSM